MSCSPIVAYALYLLLHGHVNDYVNGLLKSGTTSNWLICLDGVMSVCVCGCVACVCLSFLCFLISELCFLITCEWTYSYSRNRSFAEHVRTRFLVTGIVNSFRRHPHNLQIAETKEWFRNTIVRHVSYERKVTYNGDFVAYTLNVELRAVTLLNLSFTLQCSVVATAAGQDLELSTCPVNQSIYSALFMCQISW